MGAQRTTAAVAIGPALYADDAEGSVLCAVIVQRHVVQLPTTIIQRLNASRITERSLLVVRTHSLMVAPGSDTSRIKSLTVPALISPIFAPISDASRERVPRAILGASIQRPQFSFRTECSNQRIR